MDGTRPSSSRRVQLTQASPAIIQAPSPPGASLAPLVPLEYLQLNRRRGSITDPSLHATSSLNGVQIFPSPLAARNPSLFGRSSPPYAFPSFSNKSHGRFMADTQTADSHSRAPEASSSSRPLTPEHHVNFTTEHPQEDERKDNIGSSSSPNKARAADFDYSMRRHSIATVPKVRSREPSPSRQNTSTAMGPPSVTGQKRKTSHDRATFDCDSPISVESSEGPAHKRRGSAFDSRSSLPSSYDRRDSLESGRSNSSSWLANERRDSATNYPTPTSAYNTSGTSPAAYSTAPAAPPAPANEYAFSKASYASWPSNTFAESHEIDTMPRQFSAFSMSMSMPSIPSVAATSSEDSTMYEGTRPMAAVPSLHFPVADQRRDNGGGTNENGRSEREKDKLRRVKPRSRPSSMDMATDNASGTVTPDARPQSSNGAATTSVNDNKNMSASPGTNDSASPRISSGALKETPYSRSPELRVSHKLAERKRRKEMKELFDELRDQLPADRGLKASKWEILSKAIDYIGNLKVAYADMTSEVDKLRHEVQGLRSVSVPVPVPSMSMTSNHSGYYSSQPAPPPAAQQQQQQHGFQHSLPPQQGQSHSL